MKACPFCGGVDIRYHASVNYGRRVICRGCCAEGPPARYDLKGGSTVETDHIRRDAAYENWNKRTGE